MKKILFIVNLLASVGAASAATVLTQDFSAVSEMPEGWESKQYNGNNTPQFSFSEEKGAYIAYPWKKNALQTSSGDLGISSADGRVYSISFSLYAAGENGGQFFLSSDSYSLILGTSYSSNNGQYVGSVSSAATTQFCTFQSGTGTNPTVIDAFNVSGTMPAQTVSKDYTITLKGGLLSMSVTDGTNTYSADYAVAADFDFNNIGFYADGGAGNFGIKNISVTDNVPEPSAASLSLLGLAALAFRRRRA